jgi:tetratricopeptide (TPR) repeat protein
MNRTYVTTASTVLSLMMAAALVAPAMAAERKPSPVSAECFFPVADIGLNEAAIRRVLAACTAVIRTRGLADAAYADAYLQRGSMYRRQGKYALAFADFNESIRYDPQSADAYTGRANARRHMGELDAAIADHSEAIRLRPDFAMAYSNRGNVWRDKKMFDRAIADFDQAIRLDPKDAKAYYNRGIAWEKKGSLQEALADFKIHSQLAPSDPDGLKAVERVLKELSAR